MYPEIRNKLLINTIINNETIGLLDNKRNKPSKFRKKIGLK